MEGKVGRRLAEARSEVERVYSYAADTVGFFIDSDELWKSYGSFLESYPREGTDINTQGELMRLTRSFFHRAVVIPFHGLFTWGILIHSFGEFLDTIFSV